ncbi:MAG: ABC transporter substrate-binding protein, partial [Candidatus Sumerlaeota bacterium]|nr:ABC transporter substrate-binding protein [Candidatus Sumerlaeota bacterium]
MKLRGPARFLLGYLLTAVVFCLLLALGSWVMRPNMRREIKRYSPQEIAEAEKARIPKIDPNHLPNLYRDVDYRQGPAAPWRPKSESPILAELVKEGKLPPVAERVGPEPVVMEGPEGIGKYGGTWLRVATAVEDMGILTWRLAGANLARWSPLAYPIVHHIAKKIEPSPDKREWTITLRKGLRWSDGSPFTTNDVMYYWNYEILDKTIGGIPPDWLMMGGKSGKVEKLDDLRFKISFEESNGLFLELLAANSQAFCNFPEHYLKQYHPTVGDKALIEKAKQAYNLPSDRAVYAYLKGMMNPEHPRMWPWVYRSYKANPPQVFVRNPYYYVVDTQGNQLPYIDRIQFEIQDNRLLALSAASGQISMQTRHIRYEDYTSLMSQRESSGINVLHWYSATRAVYALNPNLNRKIIPGYPDTKWKAQLLGDKRFRQALSLAIDRKAIIKAEFNGQTEPSQVAPGADSPFRHDGVANAYIQYDPPRANQLLDAIGLTQRDFEGMRTFPDGTRMVFYLDFCAYTGLGPGQFVVDDWAAVGVRLIARERSRPLFYTDKDSMNFDFNFWSSESDYLPLLSPRYFVPFQTE